MQQFRVKLDNHRESTTKLLQLVNGNGNRDDDVTDED